MGQTRAETTRDSLRREYATDEIVVEWEPRPANKPFCDGTQKTNGFSG